MITIELNIKDIKPYDKNPRKNDNAVDTVAESIKQCGYIAPIIVDENNVILAGHTRFKALKKLGYTKVECVRIPNLTEEQKRKYRILDNKTNELAEWDYDLLKEELEGLDFGDFDLDWGIPEEKQEVEEDNYDIDTALEQIDEPNAKLGDIYQLGDHRLMCGDSTNPIDVKELLDGVEIDLMVTDPPYNIAYEDDSGRSIENDNMSEESFRTFLVDAFKNADTYLRAGGGFYIWHSETHSYTFRGACNEIGWQIRQCLIWVKNMFTMGRQDYQWKHEPCLYGWKEGAGHYFTDARNLTTTIESEPINLDKLKKEELKKLLEEIFYTETPSTIIRENKPLKNDLHPTMKPLKLIGQLIQNSSKKGENVLDLFGGSGSTLVTAEELGRKCYMMEYDPKYVDVIIDRWEKMTSKKAEKIKERGTQNV